MTIKLIVKDFVLVLAVIFSNYIVIKDSQQYIFLLPAVMVWYFEPRRQGELRMIKHFFDSQETQGNTQNCNTYRQIGKHESF